jgi:hypothetical protein
VHCLSESFLFLIITAIISIVSSVLILYCLDNYLKIKIFNKVTNLQVLLALIFTVCNLISKQINVFLTISKEFKKAAFISFFEESLKLLFMFLLLRQIQSIEAALISVITANVCII